MYVFRSKPESYDNDHDDGVSVTAHENSEHLLDYVCDPMLLCSFYRWLSTGTERLSYLGRAIGIQHQTDWYY